MHDIRGGGGSKSRKTTFRNKRTVPNVLTIGIVNQIRSVGMTN